jgi:hypothetical protein
MGQDLRTLLEIAGPPLGEPAGAMAWPEHSPCRSDELAQVLEERNGFYAFESALHVFPVGATERQPGLEGWNSRSLWRDAYGDLAEGCFFFAEDVFGGQFCFRDDAVFAFDPETGAQELMASTLEEWAEALLADYDVLTGFPLAHEWQVEHGLLEQGARLVPLTLFVLGGEFSVENLRVMGAAEGMRARGPLAVQLRYVPDGVRVSLETT